MEKKQMNSLAEFEQYATLYCTATSNGVREKLSLGSRFSSAEGIPFCMQVLNQSSSSYALTISASLLETLVAKFYDRQSNEIGLLFFNRVLSLLCTRGSYFFSHVPHILPKLYNLVAFLFHIHAKGNNQTELRLLQSVQELLTQTASLQIIALSLLTALVEFQTQTHLLKLYNTLNYTFTYHDTLFKHAIQALAQSFSCSFSRAEKSFLRLHAVRLFSSCFPENDHLSSEKQTIRGFRCLFTSLQDPYLPKVLTQTFLDSEDAKERAQALHPYLVLSEVQLDWSEKSLSPLLIQSFLGLLQHREKLSHPDVFRKFAEIIAQFLKGTLKLPFREEFYELCSRMKQVTVETLRNPHACKTTVSYLLGFWSEIASRMDQYLNPAFYTYSNARTTTEVIQRWEQPEGDDKIPEWIFAFFGECVQLYFTYQLQQVTQEEAQELLDHCLEEKTPITYLARTQHTATIPILQQRVQHYSRVLTSSHHPQVELQLAYILLFYGRMLKETYISTDVERKTFYQSFDRVLVFLHHLLRFMDKQLSSASSSSIHPCLIMSVFVFVQKLEYLLEPVIWQSTTTLLGEDCTFDKLRLIANKWALAILCRKPSDVPTQVLQSAIQFVHLRTDDDQKKQDTMLHIQSNRWEPFPFLHPRWSRLSCTYPNPSYGVLQEMFYEHTPFLFSPFPTKGLRMILHTIEALMSSLCSYNGTNLKQSVCADLGVAVAHAIRGLLRCKKNREKIYERVYDFLFDDTKHTPYVSILTLLLETFYDQKDVTTPILKCFVELATNQDDRIMFPCSSPNGILLFRQISRVISIYGTRTLLILNSTNKMDQETMIKGTTLCIELCNAALSGGYCPFGALLVYKDHCLVGALQVLFTLVDRIGWLELYQYPKTATKYDQLVRSIISQSLEACIHVKTMSTSEQSSKPLWSFIFDTLEYVMYNSHSKDCQSSAVKTWSLLLDQFVKAKERNQKSLLEIAQKIKDLQRPLVQYVVSQAIKHYDVHIRHCMYLLLLLYPTMVEHSLVAVQQQSPLPHQTILKNAWAQLKQDLSECEDVDLLTVAKYTGPFFGSLTPLRSGE